MASKGTHPPEQAESWTVDELAARTGVPTRTIRFYQANGVLPRPRRQGRVGLYGPVHAERLRRIGELQDRGLRLLAIKDLIELSESGALSLSEWLGLEEKLQNPWTADAPRLMTATELEGILGPRRPGIVQELAGAGLIEPRRDVLPLTYLVRSPGLVQIAAQLDAAGVPIGSAARAESILRRHLARAADQLVDHFAGEVARRIEKGAATADLGAALDALREVGADAVQLVFAQEIERSVRAELEAGVRGSGGRRK